MYEGGKGIDKYSLIKKSLVIGIVLIFIGIAFAPIINFNVVKASYDSDLVEVTTQACGIKRFGNTTVNLTRQQHQNLKDYLVEFRERLNQTTTKEEAIPLFKEAVVELNKYGLLPKGMNVAQTQRLVLSGYTNAVINGLTPMHKVTESLNKYCLVTGIVRINLSIGFISGIGALLAFFGWKLGGRLLSIGLFIVNVGMIINAISPVVAFTLIRPSEGHIITIGLLGIKKETITSSDYNHIALFTGIKITGIFSGKTFLLGFAADVV